MNDLICSPCQSQPLNKKRARGYLMLAVKIQKKSPKNNLELDFVELLEGLFRSDFKIG